MRKFTVAFLLLCSVILHGQQWIWDTLTTDLATNNRRYLTKDHYGNLYTTAGNYAIDSIVHQYDYNGKHKMQIAVPRKFRIQSIACSIDSSLYILGVFSGTLLVNGHFVISKGDDDVCLAKYSPQGNIQWLTSCGSTKKELAADLCMQGTDVIILGSAKDTIHIVGQSFAKDTVPEVFIARFFSTGQLDHCKILKHKSFVKNDFSFPQEITTDHAGNIYGLIHAKGQFAWDTTTVSLPYSQCLFKFDSQLKFIDTAMISHYYSRQASDITFNSVDEIYYAMNIYGKYAANAEIRKMSTINASSVTHYLNGGIIPGLDLDSCDNVYFTGYSNNTQPGSVAPPKHWTYFGMLSPAGNLNWIKTDSSGYPFGSNDIANIGLNKVYCYLAFHDTVTLLTKYTGPLHIPRFLHAIIQATFGIPTNSTPQPQMGCVGKPVTLSCITGGAVHWYNSATSNNPLYIGNTYTVNPAGPGSYTYYAEARTCTVVSARLPVTFSVFPNPTITVSSPTICAGDILVLQPTPALTYSFSGGSATVTPLSDKQYTLYGVNAAGCTDTAICKVTVKPTPSIFIQPSQNPVCKGSAVTMSISGAATYTLNQSPVIAPYVFTPAASMNIFVSATGTNNCTSSTSYLQKVEECTVIGEMTNSKHMSFFPNPSKGLLTINAAEAGTITVTNSLGKEVYRGSLGAGENKLDLTQLIDGVYLVKVNCNDVWDIKKLILSK